MGCGNNNYTFSSIPSDLMVDGTINSAYLPSYVDDVVEYADYNSFPGTGQSGIIYIALDSGYSYRWTGSAYRIVSDPSVAIQLACSDETTPITIGNKLTFRLPYSFTLLDVRASLTTAQSSGSQFRVDIKYNGGSVLSQILSIDNGAKTSTTAATQPAISTNNLSDDGEIVIEVLQIGNGTASGLKVTLLGIR